MSKQGKRRLFDIVTTLWAIALVAVALTWMASPAFADRGGRGSGGGDCIGICVDEGYCEDDGGCKTGKYEGGQCGGECEEGGEWSCVFENV